ncbi:MAG: DNA repair protein RadA [Actinobacteria bacterium]|nr:MAG: DNA repair protein RadA [Actinomycetota bacterium]
MTRPVVDGPWRGPMSESGGTLRGVTRDRIAFVCSACGQRLSQWTGRCPGCAAWGTVDETTGVEVGGGRDHVRPVTLHAGEDEPRIRTAVPGMDRVLGGGLVPGSVVMLAGPPGIGKSTLVLHLLGALAAGGTGCLLVSGEESRAQVASRARRLRIAVDDVGFAPGRDLDVVLSAARAMRPAVLAVDSIQTVRDPEATAMPGGVTQVRLCADALVGLAKSEGITVILTGHVTKHGDLAGPRALEHAVDVVLAFEGDARSGLRVLSSGKNRFGAEGETAWFEMRPHGLARIDPTAMLVPGESAPGSAVAVVQAGRRALAIEVQALVSVEGTGRRQATGLDPRRFQLVAAVLDRAAALPLGRADLFGASSGGIRIDDPASDLAVAAALASAATGSMPPSGAAFVGEISLTGSLRPAPGMQQRLAAARGAGCSAVFAPGPVEAPPAGLTVHTVTHVTQALGWAIPGAATTRRARAS